MMKDNEKKFTLPMLEAPRTLQVKFRKVVHALPLYSCPRSSVHGFLLLLICCTIAFLNLL